MGPPVRRRLRLLRRTFLGARPRMVLLFVTPTLLAIALDLAMRAPSLFVFPPREWLNYFGSSLASAGFWGGPLWLMSRLWLRGAGARRERGSRRSRPVRAAAGDLLASAGRSSITASFTTTWGATRCGSGIKPPRNARRVAVVVGRIVRADGGHRPGGERRHHGGGPARRAARAQRPGATCPRRFRRRRLRASGSTSSSRAPCRPRRPTRASSTA